MREITYHVLRGEQGGALRAVAARHSRFGQIARVLRRVHQEYNKELDVESLAREANMSVSSFHHNFKAVTSTSPVQYLKSIRLHKARALMLQGDHNASTAASRVGYSSLSQFSREFKRYFGNSPSNDAAQTRLQDRAIAPSCHNPKQLGAKFVDRRRQHALGLDARLARRVEPQQVHHNVANDGQVVGGIAAAHA